jgi:hypothetical protein
LLTCYAPVRRCPPGASSGLLARLACVKRAASVRPEPGSNSPSRSRPTGHGARRPSIREATARALDPAGSGIDWIERAQPRPIKARRDRPHWLLASLFRFQGAAARDRGRPWLPSVSSGHPPGRLHTVGRFRARQEGDRRRASVSTAPGAAAPPSGPSNLGRRTLAVKQGRSTVVSPRPGSGPSGACRPGRPCHRLRLS